MAAVKSGSPPGALGRNLSAEALGCSVSPFHGYLDTDPPLRPREFEDEDEAPREEPMSFQGGAPHEALQGSYDRLCG